MEYVRTTAVNMRKVDEEWNERGIHFFKYLRKESDSPLSYAKDAMENARHVDLDYPKHMKYKARRTIRRENPLTDKELFLNL